MLPASNKTLAEPGFSRKDENSPERYVAADVSRRADIGIESKEGASLAFPGYSPRSNERGYIGSDGCRDPISFRDEYQSNTRKARRVFHRLGRPSPSSVSIGILPG